LHGGLSHAYLQHYWHTLWSLRISRRIQYFLWLMVHAGLPVGTWAGAAGHSQFCVRCTPQTPESIRHCLWICPTSQGTWRAICLLLSRIGVYQGFVTWGSVTWLMQLPGPHLFFEGEDEDPVFRLTVLGYQRGCLSMVPDAARQGDSSSRDPVFVTVVAITLWCVWKARCSHILGAVSSNTTHILSGIWLEIIHTLRSLWDSSASSSRAAQERRHAFIRQWSRSHTFFSFEQGQIRWHFSPPQWFILHSSHQPP